MSSEPSETAVPTRVALLTPEGRGAIASLVVWGPESLAVVERCFAPASGRPLARQPIDRIVFGRWLSSGEELVVCRTALDRVEIHCHGGAAAWRAVQDALAAIGCRAAEWGQAAGHKAANVVAAAALEALPYALTERCAEILLAQYHGALRRALEELERLIGSGQPQIARERIDWLLGRAPLGRRLVKPWQVVLAGAPNVGKSSLMNTLVGYQRAIVFDMPGTTRDVVTASTAVDGWPVELSDTAGLGDADDPLEQAGAALARRRQAEADLVLLVFDQSRPWTADDAELRLAHPTALVVHNKCDLPPSAGQRPSGIEVSAKTGAGLDELLRAISAAIVPAPPALGEAVPFTVEQVATLERLRVRCG